MNIREEDDGTYSVESSSKKGRWYNVDLKKPWCDCPAYKFRHLKAKSACKHIAAVRKYIEETQQETLAASQETTEEVLTFVEDAGGEVDSIELIEKFGDSKVDELISQGELVEKKGKIKILK